MRPNYFVHPISKRFIDAFPKFKADDGENKTYFWEGWKESPFYLDTLTEDDLKKVYYFLRAKFYNWHYIYLDDLGISDNTFSRIREYYPNTKEKLSLVEQVRNMTIDEFKKSGMMIDSSGANPKVTTAMDELIDLVDAQSASFQLKSKEQALKAKFMSLYDGVMGEFTDRFKECFVVLYSGVNSYIYTNKFDGEEEEDE